MKRIAVITLVCYAGFAVEFLLYDWWGPWGKPELLILAVIFFNLYLGIRFSIVAALVAGTLKDTWGMGPFGTCILVYIAGAYLTTFVARYVYQRGSWFSRLVVAFIVVVGCFIVQAVLANMGREVHLKDLLLYILAPQLLTTMIAASFVFEQLRNFSVFCKLK